MFKLFDFEFLGNCLTLNFWVQNWENKTSEKMKETCVDFFILSTR